MWWMLTVFPPIVILGGLVVLAEAIIYTTDAERSRGEVVDVSRHYNSEGGVSYTPTIRYLRGDGQTFEAETNTASSAYDYEIGERVDILYSYDDPAEVRINSFFSLYGPGLMFVVVGAVLIRIITWARHKVGSGGAVLQRVADAIAERMQEAARKHGSGTEPGRQPEPGTTDLSKPGHVHKPRPMRTPAVRRMR